MGNYKYLPLDGLFSICKKEINNADIFANLSYAEEKINSSPKGRVKKLALLFYLIYLLDKCHLPFYVKGGIILHYQLKDKVRPTSDLDIIIPIDGDEFLKSLKEALIIHQDTISFKIVNYKKIEADAKYYYDTFNIELDVLHNEEVVDKIYIDGISVSFYPKLKVHRYLVPEIIKDDFSFLGVNVEYVLAEKIIAITNELGRPYKHLVDVYSLINTDIDVPLLKEYLEIINENDNKIRRKLNIPIGKYIYQIKEDKPFLSSYLLPCLQAGYNISLERMILEVNKWLKDNLM